MTSALNNPTILDNRVGRPPAPTSLHQALHQSRSMKTFKGGEPQMGDGISRKSLNDPSVTLSAYKNLQADAISRGSFNVHTM